MSQVAIPDQMSRGRFTTPSVSFFLGLHPSQYKITELGEQWLAWRADGWSASDVAAEANRHSEHELWPVARVEAFFELADRKEAA